MPKAVTPVMSKYMYKFEFEKKLAFQINSSQIVFAIGKSLYFFVV